MFGCGVCPPFFDSKMHAIKPASLKGGTPVVFQLIQPPKAKDLQSARPPLLVVTPIVDGPPIGGTKYLVQWTRKAGLSVCNSRSQAHRASRGRPSDDHKTSSNTPTGRRLAHQHGRRRTLSTNSLLAVRSIQECSGLRHRKDNLRRNF